MRMTSERVTPLVDLGPTRSANCRGSRLVAGKEGRWWYARCNDEEVEFVTSSAPSRVVTVPAGHRAAGLAPVEGDKPAAVVVAFATPTEGAAVVPLGKRFVVTWANANDHSVRLSEFDRTMALPAARVADEADVRSHAPLLQAHEEGVSVFWSLGTTRQRVLPTEAAGYLFAVELWRRLGSGAGH